MVGPLHTRSAPRHGAGGVTPADEHGRPYTQRLSICCRRGIKTACAQAGPASAAARASNEGAPLGDYMPEEFDSIIDINVKSVLNGCQAASRVLEEGGVIINTSSMVSKMGQPSGVGYPMSKFAVNGITISLARELGPRGIRVNAVAPGVTATDMVASLPEEMIKPIADAIPMKRVGRPEDVANAFVFLASDMASYITGAVLPVDGGMTV